MTYLISIQSIAYFAYLYADLVFISNYKVYNYKQRNGSTLMSIWQYIILNFQKIFLGVNILYAVFCEIPGHQTKWSKILN